jgi:hypothetical protein
MHSMLHMASRPIEAVREAGRMAMMDVALFLTAGLAAISGAAFLLAASYHLLVRAVGQMAALSLFGASLLVVAMALLLALRNHHRARSQRHPSLQVPGPVVETAQPAQFNPNDIAISTAFAAGFVLARQLAKR